ncbi:sulfatase-like hydrolase/transferase [Thalassoroseus pseudoceratinae]|uniref:sulfatase-like hydrolase/transferase n=1 Tax=Thalassoroseus pseudoceratinae TaxID=2713176 RepID=UPI00141EBA41|nr:sulfatase-like hydrolase/transferase [Thalassoroseus pseudoceratinae]
MLRVFGCTHLCVPFARLLAVGLLACWAGMERCNIAVAADRPSIVLILADDLGYGELGCYGGEEIPTPHIDSIAAGGVRMTDGYVTAPYCAASRAGLITGRYQTRFGFEFNPIGARNEDPDVGLPVREKTIADDLRLAGYATSLVGKWHLGGTAKFHPHRRGFDEFYGFMHEGHYFVPHPWSGVKTWLRRKTLPDGGQGRWTSDDGRVIWSTHMGYFEPAYNANNPILRGSQPVQETAHLTDAITREAVDFIDRSHQQPFFLFVSYNAVHSPMQGTDSYLQKFAGIEDIHRRIFAAMLSHLDDGVGRILRQLDETGIRDDTLVVFLSDNGGPTRELTSSNAPLRGEKGSVYEGGIRIPFLMQWPSKLPKGETYTHPVTSLDLAATFRAVSGQVDRSTDGVNLLPFLTGSQTEPPHSQLFWRIGGRQAFRAGDWKIVRHGRGNSVPKWELYNLKNDIAESTNLATKHADKLEHLARQWEILNAEMIDPAW